MPLKVELSCNWNAFKLQQKRGVPVPPEALKQQRVSRDTERARHNPKGITSGAAGGGSAGLLQALSDAADL